MSRTCSAKNAKESAEYEGRAGAGKDRGKMSDAKNKLVPRNRYEADLCLQLIRQQMTLFEEARSLLLRAAAFPEIELPAKNESEIARLREMGSEG